MYCTSCRRYPQLYIGETGRTLRERFGEHLRSVQKNTGGFPVAEHFNSPGHSLSNSAVRGLRRCSGASFRRKQLEMEIIFRLGTMQPEGLNNVFHFIQKTHASDSHALCFRYFQMNSLANLTVFTLKKGYTRNVCEISHFDTFAYFYAISNFYFLLNISVTHHPRITNTLVLVSPLHLTGHMSEGFFLCEINVI